MKSEKQLYQWDVNQYLTELQPEAQFVDYPMGNEVIRIETDGKRCRIPDEFLQTAGFKTCYERYSDGTYKAYNFNVQSSPKPPNYVYTAEERTTFDALVAKADAAIAEIKRRADSGEFTPKKGVDYFTDAEKAKMMESVSDGAIGEFRKVVDTATTEYNDNHNLKLAKYNANASEKLTTYDVNAEQRTSDYNRNAEVKLEAYNSNHAAKVEEYNQNAAAMQTEVDRLRGECDTLAAENRKQENRIDALIKLNKGQTYDILPEEGETASRTAPSGAKYVSVDNVGGKSVVEDGKIVSSTTGRIELLPGNIYPGTVPVKYFPCKIKKGETFTASAKCKINEVKCRYATEDNSQKDYYTLSELVGTYADENTRYKRKIRASFDIAFVMFDVAEGKTASDFVVEMGDGDGTYKKYFEPSQFPTGFPELRSAGTAHDEIDLDGGAIRRNIGTVDLGTLTWGDNGTFDNGNVQFIARIPGRAYTSNGLCDRFEKSEDNALGTYTLRTTGDQITFTAPKGTEINVFIVSVSGATLYYELATPTTEPVTIPEALQEWLPVEPGGTVTFRNADESKQLAVPNAVSWVRKLDEVE